MDVVLLHNPQAGDANSSGDRLVSQLRQHGYRPTALALDEALAGTDRAPAGEFVIVAGGDGSIKRVATDPRFRGRVLAPLPMGTANNIATSLGIVGSPEQIIAGWKEGSRPQLDLGLACGPWGRRHFIEGVGIGLIGRAISTMEEIDEASARSFSQKEDKLYRDLCVLLALAREMPALPLQVSVDGHDRSGDYLLLEVLNIRRAGPGFELAQHADPSDGCLHVASVRADERGKLTDSVKRCLGNLSHGHLLHAEAARELTLRLSQGEVRLDDEVVWEAAPDPADPGIEVTITLEPQALTFLLPRGADRAR